MSVQWTRRNMVMAYEPEKDDLFVQVVWHGPGENSPYLRAFEGPPWPIENYQATLDWALGIADQMRFPLHVVPLRAKDALATDYMRRAVANLTDHERGELRGQVITTLACVMRDSNDHAVRTDAYEILRDMGLVRQ